MTEHQEQPVQETGRFPEIIDTNADIGRVVELAFAKVVQRTGIDVSKFRDTSNERFDPLTPDEMREYRIPGTAPVLWTSEDGKWQVTGERYKNTTRREIDMPNEETVELTIDFKDGDTNKVLKITKVVTDTGEKYGKIAYDEHSGGGAPKGEVRIGNRAGNYPEHKTVAIYGEVEGVKRHWASELIDKVKTLLKDKDDKISRGLYWNLTRFDQDTVVPTVMTKTLEHILSSMPKASELKTTEEPYSSSYRTFNTPDA
jgi:hypothetical protein